MAAVSPGGIIRSCRMLPSRDPTTLPDDHTTPVDLPTHALDYDLPKELIATRPAEPRDTARMLVMRRSDDRVEHVGVRDLPRYLNPQDVLVFNTSAVAPARFLGRRTGTGGRVEGLFVEDYSAGRWLVMLRCNGRLHVGDRIELVESSDAGTQTACEV